MPYSPTLRQLKKAKAHRLKYNKHKYYVPTGAGEEFIGKVGSGDWFIVANFAANGVGKTCVGANIFAHMFFPCGSEWFDYPMFNNFPYPKRARIIADPTTITSAIIPELKSWFPKGRYKTDKKGKTYEYYWTTDTGWEFEIMSYDQDPKEFESATLGFVWFDEPPPHSIYKATVARMRRGGIMYITATPLDGSGWMYDHIVANTNHEAGARTYVTADIESACKTHGVRGFLRHSDIAKIVAEYSEDEKQARVFGKFQKLVGMVYKQWDRKVHVIRPFDVNQRDYCVYEMLDPHPRTPDMISWVAVDKYLQKFVVDELFVKCEGGTAELAQRIKKIANQYRIVGRLADPSAFVEDQHTGKSLATKLSEYGLNYIAASKTRQYSNRRLGDALNFTKRGDELIVSPEIYYFDTCERHIWEMEHWIWDNWKGKIADKKEQKQTPVDKDDHSIENIGRCLTQEPSFHPYVVEKNIYVGSSSDDGMLGGDDDPYA